LELMKELERVLNELEEKCFHADNRMALVAASSVPHNPIPNYSMYPCQLDVW
jgi:hypothetical protein